MDKRTWPWKKKSSEKQVVEKAVATAVDSSAAASDASATQIDQTKLENNNKKIKYVQISMESYSHLTGLEDQIKSYEEQAKTLEDEVAELNEQLSEANSEIANKEILVKQHIKISEDAVSGWEKAEAEALALKNHLESITLLKLTAEDRASHLDGALKECMRQMRNLKEEHDQKLHEVVLNKAKLFDRMKLELETKIANLDQEMLRSAAENASLSRSLQERSNMLIGLNEEKSQADTEIQLLKSKIESCEKEVNSHRYELHIARKELEIRSEEKNMSVRSAEVANKQHLEGVKKIAKLEAECQRLRGLVRKRLPGPAALAQMKLEVENLGRDYEESRARKSHVRPPISQLPEFSLDNSLMFQKDNELLTERLLAMDEETKMLKEALAKRNSELQASRNLFAQTSTKLQSLEAQLQVDGELRYSPRSNALVCIGGLASHNVISPSSFTSLSVDGNDDSVSCAGSWATVVMSDISHSKKEKNTDGTQKTGNTNHLDLMDDFLEMEKLAYQSNENVSDSDVSRNKGQAASEIVKHEVSLECKAGIDPLSKGTGSDSWLSSKEVAVTNPHLQAYSLTIANLHSKISMILELLSVEKGAEKVMEDIRHAVQDMEESLHYLPMSIIVQPDHSVSANDVNSLAVDVKIAAVKGVPSSEDENSMAETEQTFNHELEIAISQIYDFLMIIGKEAKAILVSTDRDELDKRLNIFSSKYGESIKERINLNDYVIEVSSVLSKVSALNLNILGFKSSEVEAVASDCIDKIALPENKDSLLEDRYPNGCAHFSYSASDPDVPHDGNLVPISESTTTSWKCSLEEFEQLKLEKDNMTVDLARCTENFEMSKSKLLETELLLVEVKSQLTSAQKANSLAETQLKCMAESYKSLETRAEELQNKVNFLQRKIETLDKELQDERKCHQDVLTRCKDLQEQLQRIDSCEAIESGEKTGQEMELAAAAEKLAECQETIFLLGKQLKALRPTESPSPQSNRRIHRSEYATDEDPTISCMNLQDVDTSEVDTAIGFNLHRAGSESSSDILNAACSPPDSETNNILKSPVSKYAKHHPTNSGSSSSSSTPTPEKQSRGFSRFFSSK